ncbi:MAG: RsmE family RNA methyltransferase [Spirochaetaceae bacterium]
MNIILFEDNFFRGGGKCRLVLPPSDDRADHIRRILKLEPGDTFKAGIIDGPAGEMMLEGYEYCDEGGKPGLRLCWRETDPPIGLYPLVLLVGYTRPISAQRILREAASLGVEHIVFTGTENGEKSYREAKLWKGEGTRRFLIDGLQQAGGTVLPKVHHTGNVSEALHAVEGAVRGGGHGKNRRSPSESGLGGSREGGSREGRSGNGGVFRLLLDNEIGQCSLSSLDLRAPRFETGGETPESAAEGYAAKSAAGGGYPSGHVILAVGSERGWTGGEREKFLDAGYLPAKLGTRVLRTETACAAGIALSLSRMGFV